MADVQSSLAMMLRASVDQHYETRQKAGEKMVAGQVMFNISLCSSAPCRV